MKSFEQERNSHSGVGLLGRVGALVLLVRVAAAMLDAQTATQADVAERVAQLTDAMARTQAQLDRSQHDLEQMRQQLVELQREMVANGSAASATSPAAPDQSGLPAVAPRQTHPNQPPAPLTICANARRYRNRRLRLRNKLRSRASQSIQ